MASRKQARRIKKSQAWSRNTAIGQYSRGQYASPIGTIHKAGYRANISKATYVPANKKPALRLATIQYNNAKLFGFSKRTAKKTARGVGYKIPRKQPSKNSVRFKANRRTRRNYKGQFAGSM